MARAQFLSVQPVLPSKDVPAAVEFYCGKLGFQRMFQDSPTEPRYAGVARDDVELHLQWHDPAEWIAVERPMLRFPVDNIEELFAEYQPQGVFHDRTALRETPWGTREFAFYDIDGNGLAFFRNL